MKVVETAKQMKDAAYEKMKLNDDEKKDADKLGKAVTVLGTAAVAASTVASAVPLAVGAAVVGGVGYVVAQKQAPDQLEKAKSIAKTALKGTTEVGNEFVKGATGAASQPAITE